MLKNACGAILFVSLMALVAGSLHSITTNSLKQKTFGSNSEKIAIINTSKRHRREIRAEGIQEFQDLLLKNKKECVNDLGLQTAIDLEKPLLYEANASPSEKCLIECILKRSKLMDESNKLNTRSIGHIAEMVSQNNPLVISIAVATADNCNRNVSAAPLTNSCDIAYFINSCIANEMKARKIKIFY